MTRDYSKVLGKNSGEAKKGQHVNPVEKKEK